MDALGIFWLVLYSIIGIVVLLKLRLTSPSSNHHKNNDNKSDCIKSIAQIKKGFCKYVPTRKRINDSSCDNCNKETGSHNNKDSFQHSRGSLPNDSLTVDHKILGSRDVNR
jgi:hypothetical protein